MHFIFIFIFVFIINVINCFWFVLNLFLIIVKLLLSLHVSVARSTRAHHALHNLTLPPTLLSKNPPRVSKMVKVKNLSLIAPKINSYDL